MITGRFDGRLIESNGERVWVYATAVGGLFAVAFGAFLMYAFS